jgi:hypothetical protein
MKSVLIWHIDTLPLLPYSSNLTKSISTKSTIFAAVFFFKLDNFWQTLTGEIEAIHFFYLEDFGLLDVRPNQYMQDQDKIKICTYHIVPGHNGCLTFALKTMKKMGISMGIFTKTKQIDNTYPTSTQGYTIIATTVKNNHQGGIALLHETAAASFILEGTCQFDLNIIRTILVTGLRWWIVIRIYIPPSEMDGSTINYLQLAYNHAQNHKVILLGDINVNLYHMRNSNQQQDNIAAIISSKGLHNLRHHYQFNYNLKWTWWQLWNGMNITSVCDYIEDKTH